MNDRDYGLFRKVVSTIAAAQPHNPNKHAKPYFAHLPYFLFELTKRISVKYNYRWGSSTRKIKRTPYTFHKFCATPSKISQLADISDTTCGVVKICNIKD
jgi:hypothetical protein